MSKQLSRITSMLFTCACCVLLLKFGKFISFSFLNKTKRLLQVHHENIITFIGASVDNGSVAVLTSYCARGSLEDVLMNDDLYLDQMFISSLVSDILKGLSMLSMSPVEIFFFTSFFFYMTQKD